MKDKNGIAIKNIYYMLSYSFTNLNRDYDDEIAGEQFDNIHNLFASILSKGMARQIKHGLHREYVEKQEDIYEIRGKVDILKTVQNQKNGIPRAICSYDDLSPNNSYNQILKCVATLLLNYEGVNECYKDSLRKSLLYFKDISAIDYRNIRWTSIKFDRNNQTYRMLLGISQLIIEGMLLSENEGNMQLAQFIDDQKMCRLYEKFILEYYRKEMPLISAESSQIKWAVDDNNQSLLPVMQSDIMLSYQNKILIIDAKYYTHTMQTYYDTQTIHSSNMYQIFAYVKNKQEDIDASKYKVGGMLLYAKTEETFQPEVSTNISGNEIYVRTLNLNQDFAQISNELNGIVYNYFGINNI